MGALFSGAYTPHPNSLMFNTFPVFWPCKIYWTLAKVITLSLVTNLISSVRSSSWEISPRHQRATPTTPSREGTSLFTTPSPSTTEWERRTDTKRVRLKSETSKKACADWYATTVESWQPIARTLFPGLQLSHASAFAAATTQARRRHLFTFKHT